MVRGFGKLDRLGKRLQEKAITSSKITLKSDPQRLHRQRRLHQAVLIFKLCSKDRKLDCADSTLESDRYRIDYHFDTLLATKSRRSKQAGSIHHSHGSCLTPPSPTAFKVSTSARKFLISESNCSKRSFWLPWLCPLFDPPPSRSSSSVLTTSPVVAS